MAHCEAKRHYRSDAQGSQSVLNQGRLVVHTESEQGKQEKKSNDSRNICPD